MLSALWLLMVSAVYVTAAPAGPNEVPPSDNTRTSAEVEVVHYRYKVVRSYPHDRQAFTQGLVYENGLVYEGTGLHGRSAIVAWDLKTGKVVRRLRLPQRYFGEGITILGDRLMQLTWKSRTGFVYRKDTFTQLRQFTYPTEGWGLTHDGKRLIMSDGTATLRFLDPNTYAETGRLEVRDRGRRVRGLNELEFIPDSPPVAQPPPAAKSEESPPGAGVPQGSIYANVWPTDRIAIIDPKTGRVTGWLDLSDLWPRSQRPSSEHVLNGIAHLPHSNRLLVTGKLWPKVYEIELTEKTP